MELVGAVAAVLLALAAHAVHDRLLGRVDERVERGLEDALEPGLRAGEARRLRPGVAAAAHAHVPQEHRARGVVHVHLQEAQRLVVERLEAVLALPADEARPAEAVRVEPGGAGGVVRLLGHQLDHGAGGRLDGEEREPDHLLRQLERREGALARGRLEPPRPLPRGRRRGLVHDLEGAGHAVLEPVARVAEPADAAGAREAADGPERLAHERHLAGPQLRRGRVDAAVGQVVVVAPGGGRAVGRDLQHLRRRPRRVRCPAGLAPARGPQPRVEVLLQRPQVPALELPRPVRTVEEGAPGAVARHLADATAGFLDAQREEEAGLAERPGALAVTVEEDLDADHVRAGHQPAREVDRVGLVRARVARGGAPLDAAAVHEEPVAAVGRDPASRRRHLALHLDLAPEEDEGVREGALAGQPDPAGGREVDPRAGLGRRPRALRDADGRGRGLARGGLRRCRGRRGRLRLARAGAAGALLLRPLRRLRGGRGPAAAVTATEAATVAPSRLRKARRPVAAPISGRRRPDPTLRRVRPRGQQHLAGRRLLRLQPPRDDLERRAGVRGRDHGRGEESLRHQPLAPLRQPVAAQEGQRPPTPGGAPRRAFLAPAAIESFWPATRSGRNASAVFRRSQATTAFSPLASVQSPFRPRTSKPVPSASLALRTGRG